MHIPYKIARDNSKIIKKESSIKTCFDSNQRGPLCEKLLLEL